MKKYSFLLLFLAFWPYICFAQVYVPGAQSTGGKNSINVPGNSLPVGIIANRIAIPELNNSKTNVQAETWHQAATNITKIGIILANWWVPVGNTAESYIASTSAVTAYVLYNGVCTQLTFGGLTAGTIPASGTLISDLLAINIPKGAIFDTFIYCANSSACLLRSETDTTGGDRLNVSASPLPDLACGTISNAGAGLSMPPVAIIGPTSDPSIVIVGDSIGRGLYDVVDNNYRSGFSSISMIASNYAVLNLSSSGTKVTDWLTGASATRERQKLLQYATTAISQVGTNDIHASGDSAATVQTHLASLYSQFPSTARVIQSTISSETTSTAAYTTPASQTPDSKQAILDTLNTAILSNSISGQGNFFDTAIKITPTSNGNVWVASSRASALDAVSTASSSTLTSATASFVKTNDLNCGINVSGAGVSGAALPTFISTVTNGTSIVMGTSASTSGLSETLTFALTRDGTHPCPAGYSTIGLLDTSKFN